MTSSKPHELSHVVVNDAWDEPDTGKPPCDFCRREVPCECHPIRAAHWPGDQASYDAQCMCSCGRCTAP